MFGLKSIALSLSLSVIFACSPAFAFGDQQEWMDEPDITEIVRLPDIILEPTPDLLVEEVLSFGVAEVDLPVAEDLLSPQERTVEELLRVAQENNHARVSMRRAQLTELECLAVALYHEARGEGYRGMKAVAFVIYNRVQNSQYPDGFCDVILQRSQFSFTADRNPDNIRDWDAFKSILAMSVELIENDGFKRLESPVGDALFFNSFRDRNAWPYARLRKFVATIGNHHFFK